MKMKLHFYQVTTTVYLLLIVISSGEDQVLPTFYGFFQTGPIQSVNGSSPIAHCSNVNRFTDGTFMCTTPSSSVLFDGVIPILTGLDGNMWASQLLTIQPAQPGITTLVASDFTETPGYAGLNRVEVVMFNCPQWGISASSISLLQASNIFQSGTVIATINPTLTSCDSLVRVCIQHSSTQPAIGLLFTVGPDSNWVHLAEVTFYNDGSTCPPDIIISTGTSVTFPTPEVLSTVLVPDNLTSQVLPANYRFFETGPILSVNGSSRTADCTNVITLLGGTFICFEPASSVLHDGNIPILTGLDGNMWARQLLTLQPAQPGITTLLAYEFDVNSDYTGVNRVEVSMFNCPQWGISVQSISMLEARDVSLAGTIIATIQPTITSCDSLVTVSISQRSTQPAVGLQFTVSPNSNWVHLAEVTFYGIRNIPIATTIFASDASTQGTNPLTASESPMMEGDSADSNLAIIISSSVGGTIALAVIMMVVLCIICYKYRTKRRKEKNVTIISNSEEINRVSRAGLSHSLNRFTVQSSYQLNIPDSFIIPSCNLVLGKTIGQGEFGIVYKGQLKSAFLDIASETVAVKTLRGFVHKNLIEDLLKECAKMHTFQHPNVLKLSGVCLDGGPAPYIIMPFMANGSLLTYLRDHQDDFVLDSTAENVGNVQKKLMDMTIQVGKGMEYLTSKSIVHRDLAARNCMIDINFVIKVADFGLSVNIDSTKEYFRQGQESIIKLPVKWLAPESINYGIFSEKSDVWSYGVTCWEIFSGGKTPYPGIHPADLASQLEAGLRMKKPLNAACSDAMFSVMLQCWDIVTEKRPTFEELVKRLSSQLAEVSDYLDFTNATNEQL